MTNRDKLSSLSRRQRVFQGLASKVKLASTAIKGLLKPIDLYFRRESTLLHFSIAPKGDGGLSSCVSPCELIFGAARSLRLRRSRRVRPR